MDNEERFPPDVVAELKRNHDPELIDALLTHAGDIDLNAVLKGVMTSLAAKGTATSPFDEVAVERRRHEAEMIRHEVRIFEQLGNLMTQVTDRYAALTGVPRASAETKVRG